MKLNLDFKDILTYGSFIVSLTVAYYTHEVRIVKLESETQRDRQIIIEIKEELKELKKLQNQLNRTLKTNKGWARKLEREINALSREGIDVFNKTARKDGFTYQDEATQAKLQKLVNRKQQWLGDLLTETYYDLSPTR